MKIEKLNLNFTEMILDVSKRKNNTFFNALFFHLLLLLFEKIMTHKLLLERFFLNRPISWTVSIPSHLVDGIDTIPSRGRYR